MPLGVIIHVLGSVGINLGQNMQAMGLEALGPMMHRPCTSKLWVVGMTTFTLSSLITFAALALASASVLVPLESVQFLVNLLFGKFIRKKQVTLRMVFGTVLLIAGIVLVVLFGSHEYYCYTEDILRDKWLNWTWIIYFIVTFGVAAVFYLVWRKYTASRKAGVTLRYHSMVRAHLLHHLLGAVWRRSDDRAHEAACRAHRAHSGECELAFANWFFWVELLLVAIFGGYWLFRLSQCLALCGVPLAQDSSACIAS